MNSERLVNAVWIAWFGFIFCAMILFLYKLETKPDTTVYIEGEKAEPVMLYGHKYWMWKKNSRKKPRKQGPPQFRHAEDCPNH